MLLRTVAFEELAPTMPVGSVDDREEAAFSLLIIGDSTVSSFPIPRSGRVVIGRAESCDVVIDEPQISREHAAIHSGAELELEDLGSANGTRLRGVALEPGTRAAFSAGEAIDVGSTILIVQRAGSGRGSKKKLSSHGHLEARLEEEHHRHGSFALLRVHAAGRAPGGIVERVLTAQLGRGDVVAAYARGEYTILLADTARSRAQSIAEKIERGLEEQRLEARVGIAVYPEDGSTPESLLAHACAAVRGTKIGSPDPSGIVIEDEAMRDLYRIVDRLAKGSIAVLMLGETGVGKELIAEALHKRSRRSAAPFVRLNCAALTETLAESQLFGHEKGAFTGADKAKSGLLAAANGGTVFLDEVGELPLTTQAKLLRAIEQREVLPVGGLEAQPIDVRFVAATNRDLEAEIAAGKFRRDLFYRLSGATIYIPPLRERPGEIAPLARAFVEKVSREMGIDPPPELAERTIALLGTYPWPGNIRELRNVMERSVLLAPGDRIEPEHLPLEKLSAVWTTTPAPKPQAPDDEERARILDALDRCAGNQTRAAELLGVSRRTLTKWLTRHQLPRPRKRDA